MQCTVINKETVQSMDDLYYRFYQDFHFPGYFGSNLDALYDCLTESHSERIVIISDIPGLEDELGPAFDQVRRVLADAAKECPSLTILEVPAR